MALNSIVNTTGDGSTTDFNFSFTGGYLDEADVKVRVGNEVDGTGAPVYRSITFLSAGTIRIGGTVPADGEDVKIFRKTPIITAVNDFQNGTVLDEVALDLGFDQLIKASQELEDSLASALSAEEASEASEIQASAAEASATAALASANDALTQAQAAAASANAAAATEAAVTALEALVQADRDIVQVYRDQCLVARDQTLTYRNQAQSAETDAETAATEAEASATLAATQASNAAASAVEAADTLSLAVTLPGAAFNVLHYLNEMAGGPAQVAKIIAGDTTQDRTLVTSAIHAAFKALYDNQDSGYVYFPAGTFCINDELTAGEVTTGTTFAQWVNQGGLNESGDRLNRYLGVKGEGWLTAIYVDETFVSSEQSSGNFVDSCVLRFEQDTKRETGPTIEGLTFYWEGAYSDRWKCPTALKIVNSNLSRVKDIVARGANYEWAATAIHIENMNNSRIDDIRLKAGRTPLFADNWSSSDTTGTINATGTLFTSVGAFVNRGDMTDSEWDNAFIVLGRGGNDTADFTLLQIEDKLNDNTVQLKTGFQGPKAASGLHFGMELPRASMTAGSNTVTFKTPVLTADMEGTMIHVTRVGPTANDDRAVLSAYIEAGSVSANGRTCRLVRADGTTAANARETKTNTQVLFGVSFFMGQSEGNEDGNNNDITITGLVSEKGVGGAHFLFQDCQDVRIFGFKPHGRDSVGGVTEQDFSRSGHLAVFDSCDFVSITGATLTWPCGVDPLNDYCSAFTLLGNRNQIIMRDYKMFGSPDKMRYWNVTPSDGPDQLIDLGSGRMNVNDWGDAANDQELVAVLDAPSNQSSPNVVSANGTLKMRETGSSTGFVDLLARYRYRPPTPWKSYTPAMFFGGTEKTTGYASRSGEWTMVGDMMMVRGTITLNAESGSGALSISLPYAADNYGYNVNIPYYQDMENTENKSLSGRTTDEDPGKFVVYLMGNSTNDIQSVTTGHTTATTRLDFFVAYRVQEGLHAEVWDAMVR